METNRQAFLKGMRAGIPIAMGYFAVAFTLGIAAHNAGFDALQGFVASISTYASAGEYIAFALYGAQATIIQLIIVTIVTNLRYLLMGFALNQRIPAETPVRHRLLIGMAITDEIFGVTIAQPGRVHPYYPFGALVMAAPFWALGTSFGILMGEMLPLRLVSAFSVALYGMFLAVIIPPARKDRVIGVFVAVSFALSYVMTHLPVVSGISAGNRTILLTVLISAAAAALFPVSKKKEGQRVG